MNKHQVQILASSLALVAGLGVGLYTRRRQLLNQDGTIKQVDKLTDDGLTIWTPPYKAYPFRQYFSDATEKYNLPTNLLARMALQESNYDPTAKGDGGKSIGIMQIKPEWHPHSAYVLPDRFRNLAKIDKTFFNPELAIDYAGWDDETLERLL